ncbi:MAG: hypothetical protein L6R36_007661 [Xanthoria steineri]|nr:MAG: hypothetical protein L6R36_007661 [Xanthoria steineri]
MAEGPPPIGQASPGWDARPHTRDQQRNPKVTILLGFLPSPEAVGPHATKGAARFKLENPTFGTFMNVGGGKSIATERVAGVTMLGRGINLEELSVLTIKMLG